MRLVKQFLYGGAYAIFFALLIYIFYLVILKPEPTCFDGRLNQNEESIDCGGECADCALKDIQPLQYSLTVLDLGQLEEGPTNVIIKVSNLNALYGASSFTYTLSFNSLGGQKLFSVSKESFIHASEKEKFIVEPNIPIGGEHFGGFNLEISSPVWIPAEELKKPNTQTKEVRIEISGKQIKVSGFLANLEAVGLNRVTLHILVKEGDLLIGASKTTLLNLKPFEERQFSLLIPVSRAVSKIVPKNLNSEIFIEAIR